MTTPEDRAKRAFDHLNLMVTARGWAECRDRWVAISLSDGACDQHPYASKAEAVRYQLHETQCAYLNFSGMPTLNELRFFLDTNEQLYDQGLSLADPSTYVNPEALL